MGPTELILLTGGGVLAIVVLSLVLATRMFHPLDRDSALIVNTAHGARVHFTGTVVLPKIHRAERISLAVQPIVIERHGARGVVCRDQIRVDLRITFLVRVNRTSEDVLKVAETVGSARASDPAALHEIFAGKFAEAVELVAGHLDFEQLRLRRDSFRDELLAVIGRDLQGFTLDDLAIDRLDHTPIEQLDPHNISDAEAIRKLTEKTAEINIRTNELRRREATEIAHQNLLADEQILRIERQRAEAEAHHNQQLAHLSRSPPANT